MINQLKYDFLILRKNKKIKYLLFASLFISFLSVYYLYFENMEISNPINSYFIKDANRSFLFSDPLKNSECVLYIFLIPLCVSLIYNDCYFFEKEMFSLIEVRNSKKYYFLSKIIFTFLTGTIIVLFSLITTYFFLYILIGNNKHIVSWMNFYNLYDLENLRLGSLSSIYVNHSFLYNMIYIILYSIYGGITSLLVFTSSLYVKNKMINLLIPFIIFIILPHIIGFLVNMESLNYFLLSALQPFQLVEIDALKVCILTFLLLIIICLCLIYYKYRREV